MLTIASVEGIQLTQAFEPKRRLGFASGLRWLHGRTFDIVRITTTDGRTGLGAGRHADLIQKELAPALVGADAGDIEDLWKRARAKTTLDERHFVAAMSGIDIAAYDLIGQEQGKPIAELIGPMKRDRLTVYASAGLPSTVEGYAREAAGLYAYGFKAFKMRPGIGVGQDVMAVEAVMAATKKQMAVLVDAHHWWDISYELYPFPVIKRLAQEYARLGIYWLEDPVPLTNKDLMRELRDETKLRIATGELLVTFDEYKQLVDADCCNVIISDPADVGGYTGGLKIARYANDAGKAFVVHNFGSIVGTIASLHLLAVVDNTLMLEHPVFECTEYPGMPACSLALDIVNEQIPLVDGTFVVPQKPGLGLTLNPEALTKYPFQPIPYTTIERFDGKPIEHQQLVHPWTPRR